MRRAGLLLFIFTLAQTARGAAWLALKTGPFVVYSEASLKETRERAAELEQFRFSMGQLLGRPDLRLDPSFHLFLSDRLAATPAPVATRTGALGMVQNSGPLTPETRRVLARLLLDQNVGRMPPAIERGLEIFLSTTEVRGAKVTWGAPPSAELRTPEWAVVDWLVTNPDTYGNVRVLLANLEKNVSDSVAYANSVHLSRAEVERKAAAYLQAGQFRTIDGPSRPLSAERDLTARPLSPDEVTLQLADFLDAQSESRYRALLTAGVAKTASEEGLALLALRRKDLPAASELLAHALADGSKNAVVMLEYARLETDPVKARAALEAAAEADPHSAEVRFELGQELADPQKRIEQWTLATQLAPRRQEYWIALAQALVAQKQWVAASQAWHNAEQAATTPEERGKIQAARMGIEEQRVDAEESARREAKEAQEREIRRLKDEARSELRGAEAKVNQNGGTDAAAQAVPWDQLDGAAAIELVGRLVRVECAGAVRRVVVRTDDGAVVKINASPAKSAIPLTCGAGKEQPVAVSYNPKANARTGSAGEVVSIRLR